MNANGADNVETASKKVRVEVPLKDKELEFIIKNTQEPIILKNKVKWEILQWTPEKWNMILKNEPLKFRKGKRLKTKNPQWESSNEETLGEFSDIFKYSETNCREWIYFDYRQLNQYLRDCSDLRDKISWNFAGLETLSVDDSVIWIGSEGAHTPCHQDTYSCNIVSQLYGRKRWLLFPPQTDLKPTRIPYEESSIFSQYNFYSPEFSALRDIKNCRKCILNPGDILIVPPKWWHYVENIEPAISINSWLPLVQDNEERISESIVQMLVHQVTNDFNKDMKSLIFNPNMMEVLEKMTSNDFFLLIQQCKRNYDEHQASILEAKNSTIKNHEKVLKLIERDHETNIIPVIAHDEYESFLKHQSERFSESQSELEDREFNFISKIINSMVNPDVISLIKDNILKNN